MKRKTIIWQSALFVFVALAGTLLHFLYDLTDNSTLAALFSAVNESTWEHLKLIFFPSLVGAVAESFFIGKEYGNFWCVKLWGILLGITLVPVLFYTLNGIFGATAGWINIGIFLVSAAVSSVYEAKHFKKVDTCCMGILAFFALCAVAVLFWVFTFYPPEIPLFADPINGSDGI